MNNFQRIFHRVIQPAFGFRIDIRYTESGNLSLWGSFHGNYGQIYEYLSDPTRIHLSKEFNYEDIINIQKIWKRWHLNDLRAGTPRQEAFVRKWEVNNTYDYKRVCEALTKANLLVDHGYKYGTSWLKEDVPMGVIKYLFSLPSKEGDSWDDIDPNPIDDSDFLDIITAI